MLRSSVHAFNTAIKPTALQLPPCKAAGARCMAARGKPPMFLLITAAVRACITLKRCSRPGTVSLTLYTTSPPLRLRAQIHPPGGRSLSHKSELCTAAPQAQTPSERIADELCAQTDVFTPAHAVHSSRPHAQARTGSADPSAPPPTTPGMASRSARGCTYTPPAPCPKFASKCCTPSHFLWDEQQIELHTPLRSRPT